jgi:hypothetical protein
MTCRCGKNINFKETCYYKKNKELWQKCTKNKVIVKFKVYKTNYECDLTDEEKINVVKNESDNDDDFFIMPYKYAVEMNKIILKQQKLKNRSIIKDKMKYILKNKSPLLDFENTEKKYIIKKI